MQQRKIIHIDMDAFYASVEQRDNPELKGKPLAVGGNKERGVVAAASYEARKFGVHSAMSSKIAAQKCPDLVFVKPDFAKYKAVSSLVMSIFKQYTDVVEPLSLDEAYLDVTENKSLASEVAKRIKQDIWETTQLTASAGVSYCKFLAKVASGYQKPNGLTIITPQRALAFIEQLPIDAFHGIGKVTAERMQKLGIFNGKHLKQQSELDLIRHFGFKSGRYFYEIARGIDNRAVQPYRKRKSIGAEHTLDVNIDAWDEALAQLEYVAAELCKRCEQSGLSGKTMTLKIKYADFTIQSKSKTYPHFIPPAELYPTSTDLLRLFHPFAKPIRLIGLSIHQLSNDTNPTASDSSQIPLFKI